MMAGYGKVTLGYVNGSRVTWNSNNGVIYVYGTNIMMVGSKTRLEAINQAKRNLVGFEIAGKQ